MSDIHYLMSQALEDRGHSFEICWSPEGFSHEFVLSVEAPPRGGDANWKMFAGLSRQAKPLWTYISCDVLLVYNLVTSSSKEQTKHNDMAQTMELPGGKSAIAALVRRDVTASQSAGEAPSSSKGKKTQALAGDLSLVQIPTLLQSILMAKMTGILEVEDPAGRGLSQVFFVDGNAVHCVATDSFGEEGILELLSWKDGSFTFKPNQTNEVRTIKHPLDSLLLQGMTLIDNAAYLSNLGITNETILHRNHQDLSDEDFEAHCKKGAPVNMLKQKSLYKAFAPGQTLGEILEYFKWARSQWVPVLCNLIRTELVSVTPPKAAEPQIIYMEPKRIDPRLIQEVMMSLRSPETGLFTYSAFLYFVEQEYFRAYRSSNPLSIVVFQMRMHGLAPGSPREPLPPAGLAAAVRRISSVKRHVDMLCHYESSYDYVALLPNTKASGSQVFATRVIKALMAEPLVPGILGPNNFEAAFGSASIPEDFQDLSQVLSAAEVAKNVAASGPEPVVLYKDIKDKYIFPGVPPNPQS